MLFLSGSIFYNLGEEIESYLNVVETLEDDESFSAFLRHLVHLKAYLAMLATYLDHLGQIYGELIKFNTFKKYKSRLI